MENDNSADSPKEVNIWWLQPWIWIEDDNHGSNYPTPPKIKWNDIEKLLDR